MVSCHDSWMKQKPRFTVGTGMPQRERFRICEVPQKPADFLHIMVLLMPSPPDQTFVVVIAAQLLRGDGGTMGTEGRFRHSIAKNVSG
jgi:hypothetical protein